MAVKRIQVTARRKPTPSRAITIGRRYVAVDADGLAGLEVTIHGLRLMSEANMSEHWSDKSKRVKLQRSIIGLALGRTLPVKLPLTVIITRIGPRSLDGDNATGSAKAVRDQIADWLGVNDGSDQVLWKVVQERGEYAVRIWIARREEP